MKRQTLSRATATALLGVAVLMGGGKSYASDADDAKATINEFHAALTALDLAKMDAIWVHDDRVVRIYTITAFLRHGRPESSLKS